MQEPTPKIEEEYVPVGHGKQAVPSAYSPAVQVTEQSATSLLPGAYVVFLIDNNKFMKNIFKIYIYNLMFTLQGI